MKRRQGLRVRLCSDPVVAGEAVQLHLGAADSVGEVGKGLALHPLPVHVKVWTPAHKRRQLPPGLLEGACLSYLKNPLADKLIFSM